MPPGPVQKTLPSASTFIPSGTPSLSGDVMSAKDPPSGHVAGIVKIERVNVLRPARVRDVERPFIGREGKAVRVLEVRELGDGAVRGDPIDR